MTRSIQHRLPKGVILVLTAFLMIVMIGMIAFAVDLGYIVMAKTQLQTAADVAALAAAGWSSQDAQINASRSDPVENAKYFADRNYVGNRSVKVLDEDIISGNWDKDTGQFTSLPSGQRGNAYKVTVRADGSNVDTPAVPMFFAWVWNKRSASMTAEAIATTNPRDICFVVDLSYSMAYDSDPYGDPFYQDLVQNLYDDFGFGTYPGTQQAVGAPLGKSSISQLSSNSSSPLLTSKPQTVTLATGGSYTIPSDYRFSSSTSSTIRTQRAYKWVIEEQLGGKSGQASLPGIMPAALPALNGTTNYSYWKTFIDGNSSQLGYRRYVQFMMKKGRDLKVNGVYTPWAVGVPGDLNPDCVKNPDPQPIPGVSLNLLFPAREQPLHSCRRAMIAAIQEVWNRNLHTPENLRDQVSIISFDDNESESNPPTVVHELDGNFETAMRECADLQGINWNVGNCTSTGFGLRKAIDYLEANGRTGSNKVVVLLTDGSPNIYVADPNHPLPLPPEYDRLDYGNNSKDLPILEATVMKGKNWQFYPVGLGLGCDAGFMNRMYSASLGKNDPNLNNPYNGGSNPYQMEVKLQQVFNQILSNPKLRLVK